MLDPKIIRDEPEKIRKMLKNRAVDFDFDSLIELDKKRRELIIKTDELRKTRNQVSLEFGNKKKAGENTTELVNKMTNVSQELENLETTQKKIDVDYAKLASTIPNFIHESVPIGEDETANKEIRKWGEPIKFNFNIQDHVDFSVSHDFVDLERAAKVAGARFYFLKNELVQLNHALIQYALDFLSQKNYTLVQPPFMINRNSMEGAIIAEDFENVIYKVEDEDLYLIGTSEHAVAAMHSDEIFDGAKLPIRYAGVSPCFRKEAGAHGKDQKGIFRVHQFEKIEQFVFSRPEDSWVEHEKCLKLPKSFIKNLEFRTK